MGKNLLNLNIRLFEGEGAGTSASGQGEAQGTIQGEKTTTSAAEKNKSKNPLSNVVYGKQAEDSQQATSQADIGTQQEQPKQLTPEERKAAYEKFKSEYKDYYTEDTQNIINKRFKETKTYESQLQQMNPVLEMLSSKYGVDSSDLESLTQAIEEDASFYEDEAIEKGLTVEQLKQIKKIERENAAFKKAAQETQARDQANQKYSEWMNQGEQLKSIYPSFDLQNESKSTDFVKLLQNGIDVRTAYEVVHKDEIIGGAMQYTAQQVQQQVVNNIKSRNSRPTENSLNSQGAIVTKKDVKQLTKKDRQEIAKRVERGEKISF